MRKPLEVMFDRDSLLELKPLLDRTVITALAQLDGQPVGVLASNPMHYGGARGARSGFGERRVSGWPTSF